MVDMKGTIQPAKHKTKLKIVEKKLGREKVWGMYYNGENRIELEERMRGIKYLSVLVHELLHHTFPEMSETQVSRAAPKIAKGIWQQKFRRIMSV